MKRYMVLGATLAVALGAGGAALGHKAAAGGVAAKQGDGGLSLSPAVIEHNTTPGGLATLTVANRSSAPMNVTVTARPWLQSTDGKVAPNRKATLAGVSVGNPKFTLAPGQETQVPLTLSGAPAGYLYGAVEVVGLPTDVATRQGLVLGYRVVGAIRVLGGSPKVSLTAGNPKASKGVAYLPVKNAGNSIDAVTGNVSVKDARGTRNLTVQPVKILPGKSINLPLGTKLSKGSRVSAKVTLNQRGKRVLSVTKKFTVK
jgi:hypothetical protein